MKLVLLWHQHQPPYRDPLTGTHVLPWVRLHAIKDYVDMVQTIIDAPANVRATINLTPTLLNQLEELAENPYADRMYALSRKDPDALTFNEQSMLISESFSVHPDTMLNPYRRYVALREKDRRWKPFSRQDILDLIVWFHLAWSGETLRKDPFVAGLFRKERGFSIEERDQLLDLQHKILCDVIPIHKRALDLGRIEVSTSPYHHPILPLLCATEAAIQAEPDCPLPAVRFRYPQDAERHLELAVDMHKRLFGGRPDGMWPSEGAVSEAAVSRMAHHGIKWIATDEAILGRSLGRGGKHDRVWAWNDLAIFFRDHELSDRIGFVYSRWAPEVAAADFVEQLRSRARFSEAQDPVITVALDGENAWEHFPGGGFDFLAAMYEALADADDIEMVTPSQWLETHTPERLERLAPGTWIDGSFRTWIGDPVKNRAWEVLTHARDAIDHEPPGPAANKAMEAMLCAEASDWFWWFGEGHSCSHDHAFDALFRRHVAAVYRALELPPPAILAEPLTPPSGDPTRLWPARMGRPEINGERNPYYKWASAGHAVLQQGSIHQAEPLVTAAMAIYDSESISFRLDTGRRADRLLGDQCDFELTVEPNDVRVKITGEGTEGRYLEAACARVVEVAIANDYVGDVRFFWRVLMNGEEIERFPRAGELVMNVRGGSLDLENWVV